MFEKIKRALNFDNVADQQQKQAEIERILAERSKDAVMLSNDPDDNQFVGIGGTVPETSEASGSIDTDQSVIETTTQQTEPVHDIRTSTEVVGWPNREMQFYFYSNVQRYIPHGDSILEYGAGRGDYNQWYESMYQNKQDYLGYEVNKELVDAGAEEYGGSVNIVNKNWSMIKKNTQKDWCINIGACNFKYDETISDYTDHLKETIDNMMTHCKIGSVIMFQSHIDKNLPEGFVGFNAGEILGWAIEKFEYAALDHSAGDGQCYLVIYKTA